MTFQDMLKTSMNLAWCGLLLYWLWHARGNKAATLTENWLTQATLYWAPLALAFLLLGPGEWFGRSWLHESIVPHTLPVLTVASVLVISGVSLACWSRHLLGRNWSSVVQIKQEHQLIEDGPYRHVRHPIYTGLLLAFVGSALRVGDVRGIFAVLLVFFSFWRKFRMEERLLEIAFGETYRRYCSRTAALIPGVF